MKISVQLRSIVRRICLPLLASIAVSPALWAATITVNSTADTAANDGVCTLREAITAANTNIASGVLAGECIAGSAAGVDDIVFNIPAAGVELITPATPLPQITTPVHINGYTQPGASANSNGASLGSNAVILIEIDSGALTNTYTLTLNGAGASGSIIEGLALSRNANASCCGSSGILVQSADNVWVRGNFFGTDATGNTVKTLGANGVMFQGALTGAIVGSNATTLTPAFRNVFSSAQNAMLFFTPSGFSSNVTIRGNLIGTDKMGLAKIAGGFMNYGLLLEDLSAATLVSDNVISSSFSAVRIRHSSGLIIENNLIGVGTDGTTAIANSSGIVVTDNSNVSGVVASDISIRYNVIANTTGTGVVVHRSTNVTNTVVGIAISKNIIRNNTGLPIDLFNGVASDGVTANDATDIDTGANNLQNYPVLATANGNGVTVATPYTFNSEPNQNFALEFFRAASCNASNHGGAEVYLGTVNVTTDASGNAAGTASFASALTTGFISTTATHAVNGTSEFSTCVTLNVPVVNVLLTVSKTGTGAGTVTGTGIACGADCSESVAPNTVVTLTAAATAGSTFVGWSGGGCSGTATCNVTVSAAQTVNAQFDLAVAPTFLLTISKSGTGAGTVIGTGIACGADCSESVAPNTVVALTATATAGSTFIGWSGGGCSGAGACSVTITAAQTVNAQFDLAVVPTFLLTVSKSGTGSGTVTGVGISCGGDCTEPFAQNTVVVLTATPAAGSTFAGWSGAGCSGVLTCSVIVSATATVTAQFNFVPAQEPVAAVTVPTLNPMLLLLLATILALMAAAMSRARKSA